MAGLSPRLLPKGNGVICDIGEGDRVIAFRADLDALPLPDTKDVPYRSTVDGRLPRLRPRRAHHRPARRRAWRWPSCAERGELPGRVRLIFQPAEEIVPVRRARGDRGRRRSRTSPRSSRCTATRSCRSGLVGVRSGPFTAAADTVEVRLTGPGGHTARPHLTADLVHALGRVIVDVPALLDRRVDPRAGVSMVWGAVQAGEASNAIPIEGVARGTVRILNRDAWREAPELVTQLIRDVVAATGAEVEVDYTRGVPPVINDRMATAVIAGAAGAALGADRVVEAEISMGGEDFAFYLEQVPGAMIRLGVGAARLGRQARHPPGRLRRGRALHRLRRPGHGPHRPGRAGHRRLLRAARPAPGSRSVSGSRRLSRLLRGGYDSRPRRPWPGRCSRLAPGTRRPGPVARPGGNR